VQRDNAEWTFTQTKRTNQVMTKENSSTTADTVATDRRSFLKGSAAAAFAIGADPVFAQTRTLGQEAPAVHGEPKKRPNIVLICSDQLRADFVGAYGENPDAKTPHIDSIAERGTLFANAVTNQPLCSPSRACMMTGRYATEAGPWRLTIGLNEQLPTLATVLRENGYTTNFVGKWHLAPVDRAAKQGWGWVPPEHRGGFLDFWEGANAIEITSHPYEGSIWNAAGDKIDFHDQYRVDFLTDRAVEFLKQPHEKPFLLYLSHLEPHHQDDLGRIVAPNGYAERHANSFVPPDLLALPGNWEDQLPSYYGAVQSVDESVGRVLKTLEEQNLTGDTIICFLSDHGCTFHTRRGDWKRTPQESSIHIPLLFQGPGFDSACRLVQVVSMIDVTPTLLAAVGISAPASMKGKNLQPLVNSPEARRSWKNLAYIQLSESLLGRAIRTDEWLYAVADPNGEPSRDPTSANYQEYVLYNLKSDPNQLVNLFGNRKVSHIAEQLRTQLLQCIQEAGEPPAQIEALRLHL
jgi:arylsulfatase A-like enzyme